MKTYRKKPVIIEAFQLTWKMAKGNEIVPSWFINAINAKVVKVGYTDKITNSQYTEIKTLEGTMRANGNDWIIQGINGELYPCKPDIFDKTYEEVL